MKTRLILTAVAFIAVTAIAAAQTEQPAADQPGRGRAAGNAFVDGNKDGVCDNYTNGTRPGRRAYSAGAAQNIPNRGPGKGPGQAATEGRGPGKGQGLHNGRGNRKSHTTGSIQGRGYRHGYAAGQRQGRGDGQGRFKGRGPAFVDANNDGVCDNLAAAPKN